MKRFLSIYRFITFITIFIILIVSELHMINWPDSLLPTITLLNESSTNAFLKFLIILFPFSFLAKILFTTNRSSKLQPYMIVKEILPFLIFALFSVFAYLGNTTVELVYLPLLSFIPWSLSKKELTLEVFSSQIIIFTACILLFILNISNDIVYFEHGLRHAVGFSHPNSAGLCVFMIIVCASNSFFSKAGKATKSVIVFVITCILYSIAVFVVTKSRTSFIASAFIIITSMFCYIKKDYLINFLQNRIIANLLTLFPILCFLLTVLLGFVLRCDSLRSSNFSYRFYEGLSAIEKYGISLFGVDVENFVLDNNYYCILLRSGVATFICFLTTSSLAFRKAIRNKDIIFLAFLICLHLYQMMESFIPLLPLLFLEFSYINSSEKHFYIKRYPTN